MSQSELTVSEGVSSMDAEALALPALMEVSGLYVWTKGLPWAVTPAAATENAPPVSRAAGDSEPSAEEESELLSVADEPDLAVTPPSHALLSPAFRREELRLDVDGLYPQMAVSGTLTSGLHLRVHWIASLTKVKKNTWTGSVFYRNGDVSLFQHTTVTVVARRSLYPVQRRVVVTFSGGGVPGRKTTYKFQSRAYHPVNFELDSVAGATLVNRIDTGAHPTRPASLPVEDLTINKVFRRAGFSVTTNAGNQIPLPDAGANGTWSDAEMHDAMQVHWSRFRDAPGWALWVLFASLHDTGTSLGGVMFDDIGANHRQGTAIFSDSFIAEAPAGDLAPAAWVARMRFWTAVHEMGHAFNLAHSWQKSHPPEWGTPWVPLANEEEVRSFMNYPYRVAGGEAAFFADFEFRFSDSELLFLRHAPSSFVRMGDAAWFDHHGFEQAESAGKGPLALELSVTRKGSTFAFLEPVMLEVSLRNTARAPQAVPVNALKASDELVVIVKRQGSPAQRWLPFAQYCHERSATLLGPGEAITESIFAAAGTAGWNLSEPGIYMVQVAARVGDVELVSNPLVLKIAPPQDREEEIIAQDFFSTDVARVLAFDGSRHLVAANHVLQTLVDKKPKHPVATHAQIAIAKPTTKRYRLLVEDRLGEVSFQVKEPDVEVARSVAKALSEAPARAAETLGLSDCHYYLDELSRSLDSLGDKAGANALRKAVEHVATDATRRSVRASAAE